MTNAPARLSIPKDPVERRAWVGYRLKLRGLSLRTIARKLGVSHQAVGYALLTPSERIEQVIADALEIPVTALFPERFDQYGVRIHRTRPDNINVNRKGRNSQNGLSGMTAPGSAA